MTQAEPELPLIREKQASEPDGDLQKLLDLKNQYLNKMKEPDHREVEQ